MKDKVLEWRYQLEEKLGEGAFAEVWRAEDLKMGRKVAVKLLDEKLVEKDGERIVDQFLLEARAMAKLNHPNLVTIYDFGQDGSQLYIVMELLTGGELTDRINPDEPWTVEATIDLLQQIAAGLEVAHAAGIIHRDIKPQNILYSAADIPKLTDFGLAKILSGSLYLSNPQFSGGKLIGTPEYMAPEQAHSRAVNERTDVYALAIVTFQLLSGVLPFQGESAMSTLFLACGTPREQVREQLAQIPQELTTIVLQGMAIEQRDRQAHPLAFAQALQRSESQRISTQQGMREQRRIELALRDAKRERVKALLSQGRNAEKSAQWEALRSVAHSLLLEKEEGHTARRWLTLIDERTKPRWKLSASGLPILQSWEQLQGIGTLPERIIWEKDGKEMALIPAGSFTMGTPEQEVRELAKKHNLSLTYMLAETPERQLTLGDYYLDVTPVTHAEYVKYIEANEQQVVPAYRDDEWGKLYSWDEKTRRPPPQLQQHPVSLVSWHDAMSYAMWVGKRLPTEAQWEKGARGTIGRRYPWGAEFDRLKCNSASYHAGYEVNGYNWKEWWNAQSPRIRTTPVKQFSLGRSPYGLDDMAGNVREWCDSWYQPYPNTTCENDEFGRKYRVVRGGSWIVDVRNVRAASRIMFNPTIRDYDVGFRCASSF